LHELTAQSRATKQAALIRENQDLFRQLQSKYDLTGGRSMTVSGGTMDSLAYLLQEEKDLGEDD
jgi:hypothetical protein